MRRTTGIILSVTMAMTVVGASGVEAGARQTGSAQPGYLALGDSVTFGFSPRLEDPWIPDRFVGYPELIERRTGMATANLGCPGQTAQALVSLTALDNGCFDARKQARQEGFALLHTDYRGTQLSVALAAARSDAPPSLISIQGGGNEWVICMFGPVPDPESCLDRELPKVTASLRDAVTQLRSAGYRGRVVLVSYYLVPGFSSTLRRVNQAVAEAANGTNVVFADASARFDAYAQDHDGDLCTTGLLIVLPDGSCDIHPTRIGQGLLADAVLEAAHA